MKIVLLFGGQGNIQENLFDLFKTSDSGFNWLEQIDQCLGFSLTEHMHKIHELDYIQRYISYYQLGICNLIQQIIQNHDIYLAGYSLGEVNAYLYSLDLRIQDIDECIKFRTKIMRQIKEGDLISVRGTFDLKQIKAWSEQYHASLAIINSLNHVVIGGKINDLKTMLKHQPAGIKKSTFLSIHLPSHTPFYTKQSQMFKHFLQQYAPKSIMRYPIISALNCEIVRDKNIEIDLLARSLSETLKWQSVNQFIAEYNVDIIIDIGPSQALSILFKKTNLDVGKTKIICLADFKTIQGLQTHIQESIG